MDSKGDRTSETQHPLLEQPPKGGGGASMANNGSSAPAGKTSNTNLFIASCICNIAAFSAGNALTWSSPTISKMRETNSIHRDQESWLGSLIALGAGLGPFIASALVDKIGRKTTLLLDTVLLLLSWALLAFALLSSPPSFPVIYAARLIAGVACGICNAVTPMYVAEIAEDSVRGAVGSLMAFFLCAGFLMEYIVGPYTSSMALVAISAVPPVIFAVLFFFMPESPYFLVAKGKKAKALRALQWVRGADDASAVQKELTEIQNSVNETATQKSNFSELIATKGNIKALYLSCGLVGFQQLSGITVILFYSEPIFQATGASLSSSLCTIIVGVVMVLAAGVAPPLAKCLGMKMLLIISAIGMGACQGILGVYFYLKSSGVDLSALATLPVVSMVVFIVTYCLGFGPLPWAVMGEVFPANVKANASAVTTACCWLLSFVMTKSFGSVAEILGMHVAFWIFAVFCIFALMFTLLLVPDTRGLSLQEIQDLLNGRQVNRKRPSGN